MSQDIAYSGYERIFVGRPEESFPPNNRVRLAIGADDVRAMGAIQQGVIAWSHSSEMFMLRGTVEDIVTDNPVNFSATLDQLNWQQGANSHYAVQGTPNGLIWYVSDDSVQIWNGAYYGDIIGPKSLSDNILPLLGRVSQQNKQFIKAQFFNLLEREWYILLLPIDGAITANRIVFFDLTDIGSLGNSKDENNNSGIFISDVPADAITVREDSDGGKHLLIMQGGNIMELPFPSDFENGLISNFTSTEGKLHAFWRGGWFGNDTPETVKMYRDGHLVTSNTGFKLSAYLVDDESYPFSKPLIMDNLPVLRGSKYSINRMARRMSPLVQFPDEDVSANLVELSASFIPGGQR